jgi:hypothetical protein
MNAQMLLAPLVVWADKVPDPNDVKAGWVALVVFVLLCLAVAFLGFSLTKHLRRARDNADRGVFGPTDEGGDQPSEDPSQDPSKSTPSAP